MHRRNNMTPEDIYREIIIKSEMILKSDIIETNIEKLASDVDKLFESRSLRLIVVLKGGFIFASRLLRYLKRYQIRIDFISVSSYGNNIKKMGNIKIMGIDALNISNDDNVIIVDDVYDTGETYEVIKREIVNRCGCSIRGCFLISRNNDCKELYAIKIEKEGFLVGCGMDFRDYCRELNDIYLYKNYI